MKKVIQILIFMLAHCAATSLNAIPVKEIKLISQKQDPHSYELIFDVPITAGDSMYEEYLSFSVDNPHIEIKSWKPSLESIETYDPVFKKNKKVFTKPFNITVQLTVKEPPIPHARLYVTYYLKSNHTITQKVFPLSFAQKAPSQMPAPPPIESTVSATITKEPAVSKLAEPTTWGAMLSTILKTTQSWWIRFLLAFLLGLLLSLTPCIYPMIPITVGILQSQGSKSIGRNIVLSLTYTVGIATTFALLGSIAAFSGTMFGNIMHNPWVVGGIVALIIYLALSMIGLYDLYIPSWLQPTNKTVKGGSLLSIFMFGLASGTVASPCVSPGLLLLLSLVTTLNTIVLGFGLLFIFGIGLSIPLLVIGSFSGSLNMLPRAGQWMVDIKQLFGFIMLATSFYFLQAIIPWYMLSASFWIFSLVVGIFYLHQASRASLKGSLFKNLIGIILVALSVYLFFYAYKTMSTHLNPCEQQCSAWLADYEEACKIACKEKKNVLLDVCAPCCSMCAAIDKKVLQCPSVTEKLGSTIVPVRIEDIEATEGTRALQKKYKILGAPTLLLINPETQEEIKRWGSELYDTDVESFAKELQ